MKTKEITIAEVQVDDWFFLGGRLYRVNFVKRDTSVLTDSTTIDFYNPSWMPSYRHTLVMDSGFPIQILNQ